LAKLGFDPGPVDGALGSKTKTAARLFADRADVSIAPLNKSNSASWCEAITKFAGTSTAVADAELDLTSQPVGVLSAVDRDRLWNAYKTAETCGEHATYGDGHPLEVPILDDEQFSSHQWVSPFTKVRGAATCQISAGNIRIPAPIPMVQLDEEYGERNQEVDNAASWFRRMTTYLRLSNDQVAEAQLKKAILEWARSDSLGEGIHVSWGEQPVDYQMMATISSVLSATAELSDKFTSDERATVGPWLNSLVAESAASYWKDRSDNKAYMRAYIALVWGLMVNDDRSVQEAVDTYKLAINDMRPDGSWPIDSQRGGMGLHYNAASTSHLTLIAVALDRARGLDLFGYEVDGRSIHTAVEHVVRSMQDPGATNAQYAISCPDGGDRFGNIERPSMSFLEESGFLLAYAELFPERASSKYIIENLDRSAALDSEKSGGPAACYFTTHGGRPELPALSSPSETVGLPKAQFAIFTTEDLANETGTSVKVNSLLESSISREDPGEDSLNFNIVGTFSYRKEAFDQLRFVINEPLGLERPAALEECEATTAVYDDNQHRVEIRFFVSGTTYAAENLECIVAALPKTAAFQARFLTTNFQDIAVGLVSSGDIDSFKHEGLKTFMRRVAAGEIQVGG
jgi:HAMP domain-containing protein